MKRTGKIRWGNMRVGIIITFALAMLLYSSFRGGGTSIFERKNRLVVYVPNVNGLVKGAPVWLGGVEVGNVKTVSFVNLDAERRIKVVFSAKNSVWEFLTADTKVKFGTIGLLGDKYVEIIPGSSGLPILEPDDEVTYIHEGGMAAIIESAPKITNSIDSVLVNLKDLTRRINSDQGSMGRMLSDTMLYANLVTTLNETTRLMSELSESSGKISKKLDRTLESSGNIAAKIDSGVGSLGQLVNDGELYENLARSSARFDSILARLDRGEGSAGALLNDAELYNEVREMVARMNNLISDIEANPRKYFKFSVF